MKKIISILFVLFALLMFGFFIGCGPTRAEMEAKQAQGFKYDSETGNFVPKSEDEIKNGSRNYRDIEIRVIDECQYIIWAGNWSNKGMIIHKENCNNPIHGTPETKDGSFNSY